MAKPSKTWKLVVTSIIISLIILAAFTLAFIRMIAPAYNITEEMIYSVLIKIFPILVGLVMIEIAILIGKKNDEDYKDTIDKLAPNAYDSPLYTPPVDDPNARGHVDGTPLEYKQSVSPEIREIIKEVPVETIKEVIKEVPVEVIKEVPVEVEKTVPVEVEKIKEIIKEVPVEVIKEVPVEVVREIKSEPEVIIREVERPVEVIKTVPEPYEVKVPVDVIKTVEVIKEVPVEVVKETIKEVPAEISKENEKEEHETIYDFRSALDQEISSAKEFGYDLSLIGFKPSDKVNENSLKGVFGNDALIFEDSSKIFVILPFLSRGEAEAKARYIQPKRTASLNGRSITAEALIKEASRL